MPRMSPRGVPSKASPTGVAAGDDSGVARDCDTATSPIPRAIEAPAKARREKAEDECIVTSPLWAAIPGNIYTDATAHSNCIGQPNNHDLFWPSPGSSVPRVVAKDNAVVTLSGTRTTRSQKAIFGKEILKSHQRGAARAGAGQEISWLRISITALTMVALSAMLSSIARWMSSKSNSCVTIPLRFTRPSATA